jgi:RNA polymerase II-associated factor 1
LDKLKDQSNKNEKMNNSNKRKLDSNSSIVEKKPKFQKIENPLRKNSAFIGKMNFQTFTPELPFEPKLCQYPFDPMRFVNYKTSSLEKNYKFTLFTEPNIGINIDLIQDALKEKKNQKKELDPEDIILLSEDAPEVQQLKKISKAKESWLKKSESKTQYYYKPKKDIPGVVSSSSGSSSNESKLKKIQNSFENVESNIKHPTNSNLQAIEVIPFLPDQNLWPNMFHLFF